MDVKLTVDLLNVNCFDITLHLQVNWSPIRAILTIDYMCSRRRQLSVESRDSSHIQSRAEARLD